MTDEKLIEIISKAFQQSFPDIMNRIIQLENRVDNAATEFSILRSGTRDCCSDMQAQIDSVVFDVKNLDNRIRDVERMAEGANTEIENLEGSINQMRDLIESKDA